MAHLAVTTRRHWRLLMRAAFVLARARVALVMQPFARAIRFGCVPVASASGAERDRIVWAVAAVARRAPFRAMCIEQGMAAQRLLREAGIDARLHYGARNGKDALQAHVWVTVDDVPVIGSAQAGEFREVASFC